MLHQLLYSRVSEGLEKILAAALQRLAMLLLLIGLLALSSGCGKTDTQLRVGAHSIDISPPKASGYPQWRIPSENRRHGSGSLACPLLCF